jgi:diadenylate cyclase
VLSGLTADELIDLPTVAAAIGLSVVDGLDHHVSARGYRLLGLIPRLPQAAADGLVAEFGSLQQLLSASAQDLHRVPAIDAALAKSVREGLSRIAESALLERYS